MKSTNMKNDIKQIIFLFFIFMIMLVVLGNFFLRNSIGVDNKKSSVSSIKREKVVTTVCIKKDSTLWDIAAEYYTSEYEDVHELIEEIKVSNGIKWDTIHEGSYIIVPYYVSCQ